MKNKSAFTLIEVIIAITVFAIGVLAVLRLITQNLVAVDANQLRTTATFLAKEWLELVYNMRDSNIHKWLPRDCVLQPWYLSDPDTACMRTFSSWMDNILQISFASWSSYTYAQPLPMIDDFSQLRSWNRLYYTTWAIWWKSVFRYAYLSWATASPTYFARYILFTGVREWSDILPRNAILKVESHVLYTKWSKTWEIVLESLIGNH